MDPFGGMDNVGSLMTSSSTASAKKICDDESGRTTPQPPQPSSEITLSGSDLRASEEKDPFLVRFFTVDGNLFIGTTFCIHIIQLAYFILEFSSEYKM